jgi:hypothetical protein
MAEPQPHRLRRNQDLDMINTHKTSTDIMTTTRDSIRKEHIISKAKDRAMATQVMNEGLPRRGVVVKRLPLKGEAIRRGSRVMASSRNSSQVMMVDSTRVLVAAEAHHHHRGEGDLRQVQADTDNSRHHAETAEHMAQIKDEEDHHKCEADHKVLLAGEEDQYDRLWIDSTQILHNRGLRGNLLCPNSRVRR